MNKSELIKALAEESNLPFDDASLVVNTFIDAMKDSLIAGDRIEIRGFGSFKIKEYSGYAGRNPKTGESVSVVPKRLPFFRAGKELKEYINQYPQSHLAQFQGVDHAIFRCPDRPRHAVQKRRR